MVGAGGFEPPYGGTKNRCLTAWRRSNNSYCLFVVVCVNYTYTIRYTMSTLLIVNGYGLTNADLYNKIAATENIDTLAIFTPYDPYPECLWGYDDTVSLQNYCISNNISLSVTVCSPLHCYDARFADLQCVKPWTTFFASSVIQHSIDNNIKPMSHTLPVTKLFTSLNSKARYNRCMFIDYMSYFNMIDNNHVSWNMTTIEEEANNQLYNFKYWLPEQLVLEALFHPAMTTYQTPPVQFSNSLFSFISETVTDEIMVTEKTWMAIYHHRPFLTFATSGYYKFLQTLGIELYDEVFDYSFDSIPDWKQRCVAVMAQMKRLENLDLQNLYMLLRPKVLRNYTQMLDIVKHGIGKPNLTATFWTDNAVELGSYYDMWNIGNHTAFMDLYKFS